MSKENIFKRWPWLAHVLAMIGVSLVILVVVFSIIKLYARQGQEYELPDVVGTNIAELQADNPIELDVVVLDSIFRPGQEGGRILTQDPKAGTMVKKGRKLYITMTAYSPEDAVLPELAGLTVRQAVSELQAAGLQAGKPGNSEAGHTNLGAGRVVAQDDVRMDNAIRSGSFKQNPVFLKAIEDARSSGHALHLIAYLTHKSSHGCIDYPLMLTEMAQDVPVWLHIIFDGRSTPPGSAPDLLRELEEELNRIGRGQIVDGVGRGIALDRDGNYEKVRRAYDAMVLGKGTQYK